MNNRSISNHVEHLLQDMHLSEHEEFTEQEHSHHEKNKHPHDDSDFKNGNKKVKHSEGERSPEYGTDRSSPQDQTDTLQEMISSDTGTQHEHRQSSRSPKGDSETTQSNPDVLHMTEENLESPLCLDERSVIYFCNNGTNPPVPSGRGTFGRVFLAYFYNDYDRKLPLAVKEFYGRSTDLSTILREACILHHLESTGFVPCCYGLMMLLNSDRCEDDISDLVIVQEFIGQGMSLEQLVIHKTKLSKKCWLSIASQMITGLRRIHTKHVIVNDIKMDNILLDFSEHDENVRVFFIDFGSATFNRAISYSSQTQNLEIYCHFAPEVKAGGMTSRMSDIYSLGWALQKIATVSEISILYSLAEMLTKSDPNDRATLDFASKTIKNNPLIW